MSRGFYRSGVWTPAMSKPVQPSVISNDTTLKIYITTPLYAYMRKQPRTLFGNRKKLAGTGRGLEASLARSQLAFLRLFVYNFRCALLTLTNNCIFVWQLHAALHSHAASVGFIPCHLLQSQQVSWKILVCYPSRPLVFSPMCLASLLTSVFLSPYDYWACRSCGWTSHDAWERWFDLMCIFCTRCWQPPTAVESLSAGQVVGDTY